MIRHLPGTLRRVACLGGVYSNYLALEVALRDAAARGVDAVVCLGDLGAFGPHPDRVFPLLDQFDVICLQGNYDDSIGRELDDCQCGYTDPRDNYFAAISYAYTLENTSGANRAWMRKLPTAVRAQLGDKRLLFCHGSPRQTNEFLWESTTSTQFLNCLIEQHEADIVAATHSGIKWQRTLKCDRRFVNVGVLGRPENDGNTHVWYTMLEAGSQGDVRAQFIPVEYDFLRLAKEMAEERLPEEFQETILTGWWTTCLEILPMKERRKGRY